MNKDTLRMQMLSGVITESEYKAKLEEKESLNEHYIAGGIVGVGAINNPFEGRKKESYEDAFEHFLGQKYALNEEEDVEEGKEVEEPSLYEAEVNENVGSTIEKILQSFEFSEKGNDEMIEFANYLLSPEGPKNIAMSIKSRLKGEGGENYFTSKPEALDALLSKLREDKKPGTAKERSAMAKKAHAGKDIGEKGKNFEKIAKSASKKYGSEEAGKKVAGAVMYGKLNK